MKQWLLQQFVHFSQEHGVAGYKIYTLQEGLAQFFPSSSGFAEIFCSLFEHLPHCDEPLVLEYLSSSERLVELAYLLSSLFLRYEEFGLSLDSDHWQHRLAQKLFTQGHLRGSLQTDQAALSASIHCFGFDFLSENLLQLLQKFSSLSIYLFSPCSQYWGDACADRERIRLNRYWKRRKASLEKREQLDAYLKEGPSLLANWGVVGRKTLEYLDAYDWEVIDHYPTDLIPNSNLGHLQKSLLSFSCLPMPHQERGDESIVITQGGSSLLQEVERLHASILLVMDKIQCAPSDISVLAPDIQEYAPLIEWVFSDLPYRISGLNIRSKSFFDQGMRLLLEFRHIEELLCLFENPSFCKACDWDAETLRAFQQWLSSQEEIDKLEETLLDSVLYLFPKQDASIFSGSLDQVEAWVAILESLRKDRVFLKESKTLSDWAYELRALIAKYLRIDPENEADVFAKDCFERLMKQLTLCQTKGLFPFAVIQKLLQRPSPDSQIHASHLHAIRFGSIEEGALMPAKVVFLIGMDEESFPRRPIASSLDLLRHCQRYVPGSADQDRYLLLQALFAAREVLHISYRHLSSREGKPMNPSFLIEELDRMAPVKKDAIEEFLPKGKEILLSGIDRPQRGEQTLSLDPAPAFCWPAEPKVSLPEKDLVISLADLNALSRHPWEFYLKQKWGIVLKEVQKEERFAKLKATRLRQWLSCPGEEVLTEGLPPGLCGEALKIELLDTAKQWQDQMDSWGVVPESISLQLSCRSPKKTDRGWEFPAFECLVGDNLRVKIVGDIQTASARGFLYRGHDNLTGLLKVWPESLLAASVLDCSDICFLETGKIKTIAKPKEAIQAFLAYYFLALSAPSPLLCEWASVILRKGDADWEKTISNRVSGKGVQYTDPVIDWVCSRADLPSAEIWRSHWQPILQEKFSALLALYPERSHASV